MDVIGDEYTTQRMTLRGSGGSGGGSGDGGGSIAPSGGSFGIVVNKNFYYASTDSEVALPFTINYAGTDSNYISKIEFKLLDLTATEESKKEIGDAFFGKEKAEP